MEVERRSEEQSPPKLRTQGCAGIPLQRAMCVGSICGCWLLFCMGLLVLVGSEGWVPPSRHPSIPLCADRCLHTRSPICLCAVYLWKVFPMGRWHISLWPVASWCCVLPALPLPWIRNQPVPGSTAVIQDPGAESALASYAGVVLKKVREKGEHGGGMGFVG